MTAPKKRSVAAGVGAVALLAGVLWLWTESGSPALDPRCEEHPEHPQCATTTTTTLPTTTTTTIPPIPDTIPYPAQGLVTGGGFDFWAWNSGVQYWHAKYWATGLPYGDGTTIWVDGDRSGYRCAYAFIGIDGDDGPAAVTTQDEVDQDELLGRVTFIQIPEAASYAKLNDSGMNDAVRYYDGRPGPGNGEIGDCPQVEIAYEPYTGGDQRPRIAFWSQDWEILDIRDYTNTSATDTIFELHEVTPDRVTVLAHILDPTTQTYLPAIVVYYDTMGAGHLTVELVP